MIDVGQIKCMNKDPCRIPAKSVHRKSARMENPTPIVQKTVSSNLNGNYLPLQPLHTVITCEYKKNSFFARHIRFQTYYSNISHYSGCNTQALLLSLSSQPLWVQSRLLLGRTSKLVRHSLEIDKYITNANSFRNSISPQHFPDSDSNLFVSYSNIHDYDYNHFSLGDVDNIPSCRSKLYSMIERKIQRQQFKFIIICSRDLKGTFSGSNLNSSFFALMSVFNCEMDLPRTVDSNRSSRLLIHLTLGLGSGMIPIAFAKPIPAIQRNIGQRNTRSGF